MFRYEQNNFFFKKKFKAYNKGINHDRLFWLLLEKLLGVDAELDFLQDIFNGVYRLHHLDQIALQNCHNIIAQYRDLKLGLSDASVMATAEELNIYKILTIDERDFRAVKLQKPLTLLPADK